ncbi:MAG: peptidoglycan editing factor PgeF [Kordiimonadaceae bacterium]|nr:peptidoglycan editing factor PgeF [Kordiimonadaceae bacterium]
MKTACRCPSFALPHAFMGKCSGVSEGIYASLNCGPGSEDNPENVAENRRRAAHHISGSADTPMVSCYQVHGVNVIEVTTDWGDDRPKADAMVTKERGIILSILTADCAPVIFADEQAGVIGAAHAGWKGALSGVLANTVKAMVKLGAERSRIRAAIGPCIHQESYEVESDFRSHFADIDSGFASYFQRGKDIEHYHFDLPSFVKSQLKREAIDHVWTARPDTYISDDHFSYRRSTHRREMDYGRQLSGIMRPVVNLRHP